MEEEIPNKKAEEEWIGTFSAERFTRLQMSFPPTISNNGTKTITGLPVPLQGHVVILTKYQKIQNVRDVVIFESKAFASQNPGDWIHATEL